MLSDHTYLLYACELGTSVKDVGVIRVGTLVALSRESRHTYSELHLRFMALSSFIILLFRTLRPAPTEQWPGRWDDSTQHANSTAGTTVCDKWVEIFYEIFCRDRVLTPVKEDISFGHQPSSLLMFILVMISVSYLSLNDCTWYELPNCVTSPDERIIKLRKWSYHRIFIHRLA